jgi:uncharacterized membrane protein YdbT with pleckstrin-like domain
MGYPHRLLNDDETVRVDLHPHWWFLAAPATTVVVAIGAALATLVYTSSDSTEQTVAGWASLVALLASSSWLTVRYARWLTTHFVITDRRIIFRTGLLSKRGIEIPLDRVQTVHFSQDIFERLVGAGDLLIESGAESGQQHFTDIRQPDRVQRVIHAELEERRRPSVRAATDVAEQLERLESMLQRGTLTQAEFDRQKQRLLDR